MLLSREENGARGKSDTLPDKWFKGKNEAYLGTHGIPRDKVLWKLASFEDVIAERRKLISETFANLLFQLKSTAV